MARTTGQYHTTKAGGETVRAFVPVPLPPVRPALVLEGQLAALHADALAFARREIASPQGLPLTMRLLCAAHKRLMRGARGAEKQPGGIRTSQNWIGGTRPGNAAFVPPPPEVVATALSDLERWIH